MRQILLSITVAYAILVSSTQLSEAKIANTQRHYSSEISEAEQAKAAEKLYLGKQYEKAAIQYSELLSKNPNNFKYNYYYGICALIIDADKSAALPYLKKAMNDDRCPEDIFYYYGRACHLTYRFDEAAKAFSEYAAIIGKKATDPFNINTHIEMVMNAKTLLDTNQFSEILEDDITDASNYYSKYEFTADAGKLLSMPDQLIKESKSTKADKPTIFLSANGRVMYFSASKENKSKDIYRVEKDFSGNWGAPVKLDSGINSNEDELYSTCNSDGRILYFSSRGHHSTGGLDIFKVVYNSESKKWGNPENMGSPVNSPDDDYCYISSGVDQYAYVTSQRDAAMGKVTVLKVPYVNSEELSIAVTGKFKCIGESNLKEATITITKNNNPDFLAILKTDAKTGEYSIELPGTGAYNYSVEVNGYEIKSETVRFGEFNERSYIQNIYMNRNKSGAENLAISNLRLTEVGTVDENLTANGSNSTDGSEIRGMSYEHLSAKKEVKAVEKVINKGLQYKVQIGAFSKLPKDIVEKNLSQVTDVELLSSYGEENWLKYFVGSESTYESAKNLKETMIQAGFTDAFIVTFENEKPVKGKTKK
ncbi:MAG: tetratricopeptide repeat protein [Bacteroidota bacterium]